MSFFSPYAFFFALAALPIIGFYLLKVRQRKVTVPTLMFWNKVFQEKAPRSLLQKLRHPLSLLAQLLLLMLLVLALADPSFSGTSEAARKTVIIIDNSASMRAPVSPGGSTRLEAAKQKSLALVEGLRYFDTMAVIAASGEPQIISGMTDRQSTLRQRITAITPTDAPTRLAPAVDLARTLLAGEKNPAILLLSDGCFDPDPKLTQPDIQFIPIADPNNKTRNIGITAFQTRRSLADPTSYDTFIQIESFGSISTPDAQPIKCTLELSLDQTLIDVIPLTLDNLKPWRHTLTKSNPSGSGGRLTANLIHPDALATDNHAFAFVPPARRTLVDLSGAQSFFLRKAFESLPLVDIAPLGSTGRKPDITVLYKTMPAPLPPGPLLIIDPQTSTELFTRGTPLTNPGIQPPATPHPLLANVQWQGIYLPAVQKLQPLIPGSALVSTLDNDPLLFSALRPNTNDKLLIFTAGIDAGDFPLRTAFPIFLANAVNHFAGLTGEFTPSPVTGRSISFPRTSATTTATLTNPAGALQSLAASAQTLTPPILNQTGFWNLTQDNTTTLIPVNLCDPRESNLTPTFEPSTTQPAAQIPLPSGAPPWFYLLAAGLTFLALEWYLYQRRWIS